MAWSGRFSGRLVRRAGVLILALALLVVGHAPILRATANVLIAEDALAPAAAIIVLSGGPPFREMEAADLYRAGWASRIVLVREVEWEEGRQLRELGIAVPERSELSYRVLAALGVPPAAVLTPGERARNTLEELQIAARALKPLAGPVILVTSKVHTRRVGLTWGHVAREGSRGIVRATRYDPFDPDRWWLEGRFFVLVAREYAGLVGYGPRFLLPAPDGP